MLAAALIGLLATGAAAAAPAAPPLFVPAVGVGEPLPSAAALQKMSELFEDGLRRAAPAAAPSAPSAGERLVEEARAQYYDLRFPQALASAEAALERLGANADEVARIETFLLAHVFAALALLETGQEPRALEHLTAALTVRPDLHLPESEYAPTALAALERARDRLIASPKRAELTVSSVPPFAKVRVDGLAAGETPLKLRDLPAGRHLVEASHPGFLPERRWVDLGDAGAEAGFTLRESPVEQLRRDIATAVAAGAAAAELEPLARRLAQQAATPSIVLLAVARRPQGYVAVAARAPVEGRSCRTYAAVGLDLVDAPAALQALASAVTAECAADKPRAAAPIAVAPALDFAAHFLGMGPPARAEAPPPPPPVPLWKKPWFWGAAAGVAAATGAGIYFATRPEPTPPGVVVTLELPQ